ncbi:MAG: M2 family metallopeptidase [Myxococcota bacterium]|nr:M2 family metallopeptidase [Myxococcota bacterium]
MTRHLLRVSAAAAALVLSACASNQGAEQTSATAAPPAAAPAAPQEDAKAFVARANQEFKSLNQRAATAEWIKSTYITDDTERNAAWVNEALLEYTARTIKQSAQYRGLPGQDADTQRMLYLLSVGTTLPAPQDAAKRQELAQTLAKLEGMYGKGEYCKTPGDPKSCRDLQQLSEVFAKSRNYNELLDAWNGWHTVSRPMRPLYERLVSLSHEGAKEIGYQNLGELWRSSYDMEPEAFEKETDRLWQQVKPLYDDLHCYVRGRLARQYGQDKVPLEGPIPAHLLGNMWAQEWNNIYPLVEPFPGQANLDVTGALVKKGYDPVKMVKLGESFFTSLGMNKLPDNFWTNSMFVQPPDRKVVCHASAWDLTFDAQEKDLRIKMCIKIDEEDLVTVHHELGHNYYYLYYNNLPMLYQAGANDGFHEAIGDALTLSITPAYLQQAGILGPVPKSEKNLINLQLKDALEKVAFLPFGKLIDQWRWDVFSGKVTPENYNQAWWALRTKFQGVAAPSARTEQDFDPGAKYHIPANVPYTRYFLARILQFQFHKAMCEAAGIKGPLHECSIYGNKVAGAKLQALLELGASKPWQEALFAMAGTREMDATPLVEYFQPLHAWLKTQNQGKKCGW